MNNKEYIRPRRKESDYTCSICNITNKYVNYAKQYTMYLCNKHYKQMSNYSKIIDETPPKPRRTNNEYIQYEKHSEISLYNKSRQEHARAKIDSEDMKKCKDYVWYLKDDGYVVGNESGNKTRTSLHRFIMDSYVCADQIVDHINHDKLDNRKINLRICTSSQNSMNRVKSNRNTSGFVGISWNKRKGLWVSKIEVNKNSIFLGYFKDMDDAVQARKEAEDKYFGEFKYNQFIITENSESEDITNENRIC